MLVNARVFSGVDLKSGLRNGRMYADPRQGCHSMNTTGPALISSEYGQETITIGNPYPLGPTLTDTGVNFSIFSSHATQVCLLLYETADALYAERIIRLDPITNRTSHYWHVHVAGIGPGQVYAYRMSGPY